MDARSAREWSSEAAARAICPNSLRQRCCISEETGGWLVCDRTDTSVTCAVYGAYAVFFASHIYCVHFGSTILFKTQQNSLKFVE